MYNIILIAIILSHPPLIWNDFKMKPSQSLINKGYMAITNTQWRLIDSTNGDKHFYIVEDWFNPDSSWTVTNSSQALAHEQTHYNISVLWANRLRNKISTLQGSKYSSSKASDLFDHCWKEELKLQALFDKETNHGLNKAIELKWEEQIKKDL